MGALEPPHLIVILVIVLIVFGPGKLPQLGKAIGDGIRELKHATNEESAAKHAATEHAAAPLAVGGDSVTRACPQCQSPVPATARFCGVCGAAASSGTTAPSGALESR
jgi:sec-independent protein translocase protein TatA